MKQFSGRALDEFGGIRHNPGPSSLLLVGASTNPSKLPVQKGLLILGVE